MPKILINEKDQTSPGTPGSYANYSVLITGYMGRTPVLEDVYSDDGKTVVTKADKVLPDTNGVYEFNSADDFKKIIGCTDIEKEVSVFDTETSQTVKRTERHYGNRMAYELLNLGYVVIYKPIKSISEMDNGDFWEVFKDKASYDFRFVSHGLLETNHDDAVIEALDARKKLIAADRAKLDSIDDWAEALRDTAWDRILNGIATEEASKAEGFESLTDDEKATAIDAEKNNIKETVKANINHQEKVAEIISAAKQVKYSCVIGAYNETIEVNINDDDKTLYDAVGYTEFKGEGYTGFRDTANVLYVTYTTALAATENTENQIAAEERHHDSICVTPQVFNNINGFIAKLASYRIQDGVVACDGRGDCIALIELDERKYRYANAINKAENLIIEGIEEMSSSIGQDGAYCAMTVPSVYYKMSQGVTKFPAAFHYLACFMNSLSSGFAEWYAAAGYNRGVASYAIDHTSVRLGEIAINALEPRYLVEDENKVQPTFACNVIANFRGSYYLWGNRTAYGLKSAAGGGDLVAHHFLNIRQLCTTIKKQLYVACRRFTFDPNSDTLWFNFVNAIAPTLDAMKANQGVRDYKILKVYTDKKATLKAKIRIIPIEAVEDFDLEVSLEDSFGEASAVVTE